MKLKHGAWSMEHGKNDSAPLSSEMCWVVFSDMNSGGRRKLPYETIFIEAFDKEEAIQIFINKFSINPDNVTCTCCGADYHIRTLSNLNNLNPFYQRKPIFITHNGITTSNIEEFLDPDDPDDPDDP